ncbi:nucleotidyltransferase [Lentzea sp. NPDC059081]|uniref:nucleotidyltransferase n=1 Tax=Lentzea sp. NPDC059081 TaxID=3346719 RepID=UPI0036B976FA
MATTTLNPEFDQAVRNVTVNENKRELAIAAHTEIQALLNADEELRGWGINPYLIGSYGRLTARYPGKDVDVFLRFEKLSVRYDPAKIYAAVERVLVAAYGLKDQDPDGRVTRQARSLNIDFPDPDEPGGDTSFSIDAVPAVPWQEHWGIPNRDRDEWNKEDKRWIKTNPIKFGEDTEALAVASWSPQVGSRNAYRPVVRLLRQVRHTHLGRQRPGGLYVEVAAYHVWKANLVTGSTWAELLTSTLEQIAGQFTEYEQTGLPDPVFGTPMKPVLDYGLWTAAASSFTWLAQQCREALDADPCQAAKIWRSVLGTNERGEVLILPDGCDANGFPLSAISPVTAVGNNQPRGFASDSRNRG